jgi:hypothetical protein
LKHPSDLIRSFVNQNTNPLAPQIKAPINAFQSLFSVQDLSVDEKSMIENAFLSEKGHISDEQVQTDVHEVERLTKELKAIKRQGIVFIGERIHSVREIFKRYKDRSFREWMKMTFGSFKTGYNYLAFYELYVALPLELQERLVSLSAKEAYRIASKDIPLEEKVRSIKEEEWSPSLEGESSSDLIASKITHLHKHVQFLRLVSVSLSLKDRERLKQILETLEEICLS